MTQGDVSEELPVRLELTWLPSPGVRFQVTDLPPGFGDTGRGTALQLPDGTRIENLIVTAVNQTVREGEYTARMAGVVNGIVTRGQPTGSAYATFLLPNVDPPIGSGVRYPGRGQAAARTVLNGSGWRVTLDWAEYDRGSIDFLRGNSGYAVTMVGRAEREDGSTFSREQASELLGALGWYLSFYAGRWTGPCLIAGHDTSGTTVWEEWRCSRVTPFRTRQSWADTLHPPCFFEPFPGFLARWQDAGWAQAVRLAIHWYLEANAQAGSTEGSIVLTQTAFELLAYAVLVDDGGWLSPGGYGNLGAADLHFPRLDASGGGAVGVASAGPTGTMALPHDLTPDGTDHVIIAADPPRATGFPPSGPLSIRDPAPDSPGCSLGPSWPAAARHGLDPGRRPVRQYRPCYTTVAAAGKSPPAWPGRVSPVADAPRLVFARDDTPTPRAGPCVPAAGVHHNPTPGPAGGPFVYGHVWAFSACSPPTRPGAPSPCPCSPDGTSGPRIGPASRPSTGRCSGPSWSWPSS